jgi:hypothetical protein
MINDARCTQEIKSKISIAKAAFNKKKSLFTRKLKEKISNMLHLEYSFVLKLGYFGK